MSVYDFQQAREAERYYLYRFFDEDESLLYVGLSINAYNRFKAHRHQSYWFKDATTVKFEFYPDLETVRRAETTAIRTERPRHNVSQNERTLEEYRDELTLRILGRDEPFDFPKNHGGRFVEVKERKEVNRPWINYRARLLDRITDPFNPTWMIDDDGAREDILSKMIEALRTVESSNPFSEDREKSIKLAEAVFEEECDILCSQVTKRKYVKASRDRT